MSLTSNVEYKPRTQKSIRRIASAALEVRAEGHQATLTAIDLGVQGNVFGEEERDVQRDLIASLNYSRSQAEKELKARKKEAKAGKGKVKAKVIPMSKRLK